MTRRIWEINFMVTGPVLLEKNHIQIVQEKGFDMDQFYSNISLKKTSYGFDASITAYADDSETAITVGYVFFEKMINILSLNLNIPLEIDFLSNSTLIKQMKFDWRKEVKKEDFQKAFSDSRLLEQDQPKLARSIGWYYKATITDNIFDQFISYWTAIEVLASNYHTKTNRTASGTKNQIYQCIIDFLGQSYLDNVLPEKWIDDMNEERNNIVHGVKEFTYEEISSLSKLVSQIEKVAKCLIDKVYSTKVD